MKTRAFWHLREKIPETISVLREGLRLFPNDYEIMADLATYLDEAGTSDEERKKNRLENVYKQHWNDDRMKHLVERLKTQAEDN